MTDAGRERPEIRDVAEVIDLPYGKLLLVADGMGNGGGSAEVGAIAVDAVTLYMTEARVEATLPDVHRNNLRQAFIHANRQIFASFEVSDEMRGVATSLLAVLIAENRAYVANSGVARLFLVRNGRLTQVTKGVTTAPQSEALPGPPLSRPLGMDPVSQPEILASSIKFQPGDLLILCSNGLYDVVGEEEIAKTAGSFPAEVACIKLVEMANERGGPDNIALVVYQFTAPKLKGPEAVGRQAEAKTGTGGESRLPVAGIALGLVLMVAVTLALWRPWESGRTASDDAGVVEDAVFSLDLQGGEVERGDVLPASEDTAGSESKTRRSLAEGGGKKAAAEKSKTRRSLGEGGKKAAARKMVEEARQAAARGKQTGRKGPASEGSALLKKRAEEAKKAAAEKSKTRRSLGEGGKKAAAEKSKTRRSLGEGGKKAAAEKSKTRRSLGEGGKKAAAAGDRTQNGSDGPASDARAAAGDRTQNGSDGPASDARAAAACVPDAFSGTDRQRVKKLCAVVAEGRKHLKAREGADAAKSFTKAKWRLGAAPPEVKSSCRPLVDEFRVELYREYLRLAAYFVGRKNCSVAKARAEDARYFGAPEDEIKETLGKCYAQ